jgi:flotillin
VALKEADRKEKELIATQIRPAEAQREASVIAAEGEARANVQRAEGEAKGARLRAEGQRDAQIAMADAQKAKLTAEGEGAANADRAQRQAAGEGEGAAIRARGEAEGSAIRAKGLAEGEAIKAKLLAEAEGIRKKAEAYKALDRAATIQLILEKSPEIIDELGQAAREAFGPFAELGKGIGTGLGNIDKVNIVDLGGNGKDGNGAVGRFAMTVPDVLFGTIAKMKTLGIDVESILKKVGIDPSHLNELLGEDTPAEAAPAAVTVDTEEEDDVVGAEEA